MSIPTQTEMYAKTLRFMAEHGEELRRKEIKDCLCGYLELSDEDKGKLTSSGVPVYGSRIGWAISNLNGAGLLDKVAYGVFRISDKGQSFVEKSDAEIASEVLKYRVSRKQKKNQQAALFPAKDESTENEQGNASDDSSPVEKMDDAIEEYNAQVAHDILDMVYSKDPQFLEQLAVDLFAAMGYGEGKVTQYSVDGGVDGIMATDALGFDPIYIQTKRYDLESAVGVPDVQKFAGAMNQVTRGVFVTTARFSKKAEDFAKSYKHATISLIDGEKLARLMMKFNVGCSTERVLELKKIDSDYFDR